MLGCFLDGISMVVLTMGVILPTVEKAGIDLLWFGIFIVLVVEMAQITPPVGFNLFVLQGMTGKQITWIARNTVPMFLLMVVAVLLIWFVPRAHHVPAAADEDGLTPDEPRTMRATTTAKLRVAVRRARHPHGRPRAHAAHLSPARRGRAGARRRDRRTHRCASSSAISPIPSSGSPCRSRPAARRSSSACGTP